MVGLTYRKFTKYGSYTIHARPITFSNSFAGGYARRFRTSKETFKGADDAGASQISGFYPPNWLQELQLN